MATNKTTILIVDDEVVIRRLLRQKLSREGYCCREAGNADEAISELRSSVVELMILDIKMPGKSGIELLAEIKAGYPETAVIMATAVSEVSLAIECMKRGAYDYLAKPFNLETIVLSVSKALEKRRLALDLEDYREHLERRVEEQAGKIRGSRLKAVMSLAYALEAKDRYTSGHSRRVAEVSAAIARELGLSPETIDRVELAGKVHDVGKMGVREAVLNKPGGLTEEEFEHVAAHPEAGERILAPVVDDKEILRMVRHHHERYDGSGYPDGLAGELIPIGARILAVADAYDAMTSERPYRKAMDRDLVCREIKRGMGSQFDAAIVEAFLRARSLPCFGASYREADDNRSVSTPDKNLDRL